MLKATQPMQPAFMQVLMQSQQAWIILTCDSSPLMHMIDTPSEVFLHSVLAMAMLHRQIIIPFIVQQRLHMPLPIMRQRFCRVAVDISSSQTQLILIPLACFSNVIWQRGIIMAACGIIVGISAMVPIPIALGPPIIPDIIDRPNIIVLAIGLLLSVSVADLQHGSTSELARSATHTEKIASTFPVAVECRRKRHYRMIANRGKWPSTEGARREYFDQFSGSFQKPRQSSAYGRNDGLTSPASSRRSSGRKRNQDAFAAIAYESVQGEWRRRGDRKLTKMSPPTER
jgi:hypothetical protein